MTAAEKRLAQLDARLAEVEQELAAMPPLEYQRLLDYERYGLFGRPCRNAKRLAKQKTLDDRELGTINRRHDREMRHNPWFRLYKVFGNF